ncbi:PA2169 family four-helix-bundle protein [Variovorax paradoxus]|nr:PA2169 family four-helix-bundle protein [Variovorax paradoxus]MBT2305151.1 PA2169 family four-helix-bundle protein [Variovorax paradoxus]
MAINKDLPPTPDLTRDPGTPVANRKVAGVGATSSAMTDPVGAAGDDSIAHAMVGVRTASAAALDPLVEDAHWRETFNREPYYETGRSYDDYRPAYEMGWSSRVERDDDFEVLEPGLERQWSGQRGNSTLEWHQAHPAVRAAWERIDRIYYADDGVNTSDVVRVLNDLLVTTHDTESGLRSCVTAVESSSPLKKILEERAQQCGTAALELSKLIRRYHAKPAERGTAKGAMHCGWVLVKGAVGAISEQAILDGCERGEDMAVARYRRALEERLPSDVRQVIERQARRSQNGHDQIKKLRDQSQARERS